MTGLFLVVPSLSRALNVANARPRARAEVHFYLFAPGLLQHCCILYSARCTLLVGLAVADLGSK